MQEYMYPCYTEYFVESAERLQWYTLALWPANSNALATCWKSPLLLNWTLHNFTSGVKPLQEQQNLLNHTYTQLCDFVP